MRDNTESTEHTEHTEKALERNPQPRLLEEELTEVVRQTAFEVHRYFGCGFLEAVYRRSLQHRLRKKGLDAAPCRFTIRDEDGTVVGVYEADLLVERKVLIEAKAASALRLEHEAQTLNYLRSSGLRVGLLINFGRRVLQIRRCVL